MWSTMLRRSGTSASECHGLQCRRYASGTSARGAGAAPRGAGTPLAAGPAGAALGGSPLGGGGRRLKVNTGFRRSVYASSLSPGRWPSSRHSGLPQRSALARRGARPCMGRHLCLCEGR